MPKSYPARLGALLDTTQDTTPLDEAIWCAERMESDYQRLRVWLNLCAPPVGITDLKVPGTLAHLTNRLKRARLASGEQLAIPGV